MNYSNQSIGDFRAQINRNTSIIYLDGKEYIWDTNDIMFYLDDSIIDRFQKNKKDKGMFDKEKCPLCDTSLRKIYMNTSICDFCGKSYWKKWCSEKVLYPKSRTGKKGTCCRIWLKKFEIKEQQHYYETEINKVDEQLKVYEGKLVSLNRSIAKMDEVSEENKTYFSKK